MPSRSAPGNSRRPSPGWRLGPQTKHDGKGWWSHQWAAPAAEAALLSGWLRSRLGQDVEVVPDEDAELRVEQQSPSELLSAELDELGRNRIYEEAVRASV
jgi:hypothetical protein